MSPIPLTLEPLLTTATVAALTSAVLWQRRALTRARYDATHDEVTGIPNRRAYHQHLHRHLHAGRPTGVVLLDLDRFKAINDAHGHRTGNTVLAAVAERLNDLADSEHGVVLAARLSGDEFALLVDGDRERTAAIGRRAWQVVCHPMWADGREFCVYASVGHASAAPGVRAQDLLHQADLAMYRAKTCGREVVAADTTTHPEPAHPAGAPIRPRDRRHHHLR